MDCSHILMVPGRKGGTLRVSEGIALKGRDQKEEAWANITGPRPQRAGESQTGKVSVAGAWWDQTQGDIPRWARPVPAGPQTLGSKCGFLFWVQRAANTPRLAAPLTPFPFSLDKDPLPAPLLLSLTHVLYVSQSPSHPYLPRGL